MSVKARGSGAFRQHTDPVRVRTWGCVRYTGVFLHQRTQLWHTHYRLCTCVCMYICVNMDACVYRCVYASMILLDALRRCYWGFLSVHACAYACVWMKIAFIITRKRNNVVVSFGTLKVQSFMLTEVRDCDCLIVVTSSTFLKRKDILKEKR